MNVKITSRLSKKTFSKWRDLIISAGLNADECSPKTVLVFEGDTLVATGGRDGCVLKHFAVDENHRGEDLTALVLTELRRDAFKDGYTHLFLYTKPENRYTFESLFFYPIVQSQNVLVMENKQGGLNDFLSTLPNPIKLRKNGAIVMNANPFTLGHQYLIERAAAECDNLYVFVLSEDKSEFFSNDRIEMVKIGTAHIPNVTVLSTGPYILSSATFPTYFIKDRDKAKTVACEVDIEIFIKHLAPRLNLTCRYVGTEPFSTLTATYNAMLKDRLSSANIEFHEIERLENNGTPISASRVRELIKIGDIDSLESLVPNTTLNYLREKNYL